MEDVRMMDNQNNHDDASERLAQLEATNAILRQTLSSRDEHIAMLEERLLTMSVELASSRAREDEQRLMLRQSAQLSQRSLMSEDDGGNVIPPDNLIPNPVRNSKNGRRRRGSRGSSVSPAPTARAADQTAKSAIDDSVKSAPALSPSSSRRRFSMMCSRTQDDIDDSARSLSSTGVGGLIGNIINALDRSDNSDDLSVNFPSLRRRSSMMSDDYSAPANPPQEQRRMSAVGHLFRLRKSELTADDAVEEVSCEQEEEQEHGEEQEAVPQRRRPNRSMMMNRRYQASTRLISSTVAFPREDDDDCLGFE